MTCEARIRPMAERDIVPIADLARVIWLEAYPDIISRKQIDYMLSQRYAAEVLRAELADPAIAWDVLEEKDEIIGFASCQMTEVSGEMKLDKLYVHPARQRRGHGERLVRHAIETARAKGCHALVLAVNKRNARALAAYRKYGFEMREAIAKDIGGGFVMDDFIMVKCIE